MLQKIICSVLFFSLAFYASGQPVSDDLPRVTSCIALTNVMLKSSPGKEMSKATLIIRDGLITHIGQNIAVPADAYRIEADSFYAYPAFIDAFSYIGVKELQGETPAAGQGAPGARNTKPAVDAEGNLSLEDAGILPFRSVRTFIDAKDKSISDWRAQGFAIAHSVPKGKIIPGKGAIVILSGNNADEMIWKEDISMFGQWTGAGGNYPSTVIAVAAKWRELYHNATNYSIHQALYESTSTTTRPEYNQAHKALLPVIKKELPVYFRAPKVKDMSRALALQSDLGMRMVIADAEEAWLLKDRLKAESIPVVLSLDLPEEKGKKEEKEEKEKRPAEVKVDSLKKVEGEKPKPDPERDAFEKRRSESLQQHRAQAKALADAGIPFSFGTLSIKSSDFMKNLQLIKAEGLSDEQLLTALTTQPAKLLGIERNTGSIEVGKMGNIIISNKPIFEKESAIKYMIVEGDLYEYEIKEKKKKSEKGAADSVVVLNGKWSYVIETPDQTREGTFEFSEDQGVISGKIKSPEITSGHEDLDNIIVENEKVSFTYDLAISGQIVKLEFNLTLQNEILEGSVRAGELGTYTVKAERISKPDQH